MSGPEQVLEAVAARYRLGAVADWAWVGRGSMGEVYRLACDKRQVAAKRLFWGESDDARLLGEIAFADSCRAAGVPSPATLVDPIGDPVFVDRDTGDRWRLQEWVDGEVPDRADVPSAIWIAEQIAVIHRLAIPAEPDGYVSQWYCRVNDGWDDVLSATEHSDAPWVRTFRSRVDEFRALAAMVNAIPMGKLVRCHRDALAGNTMVGIDGRRWLIDWENYGAMEPWRELGVLLLHHVRTPETVAAIARRYRDSGGAALPTGVEIFASGLAIWLNYLQGKAVEAVDVELDADHREFAIGRVRGLVSGIPGLAELEAAAGFER